MGAAASEASEPSSGVAVAAVSIPRPVPDDDKFAAGCRSSSTRSSDFGGFGLAMLLLILGGARCEGSRLGVPFALGDAAATGRCEATLAMLLTTLAIFMPASLFLILFATNMMRGRMFEKSPAGVILKCNADYIYPPPLYLCFAAAEISLARPMISQDRVDPNDINLVLI